MLKKEDYEALKEKKETDLTADDLKDIEEYENNIKNNENNKPNNNNNIGDNSNIDDDITNILDQNTKQVEEKINSKEKAQNYQKSKIKETEPELEEKGSLLKPLAWLFLSGSALLFIYKYFVSQPLNGALSVPNEEVTEEKEETETENKNMNKNMNENVEIGDLY